MDRDVVLNKLESLRRCISRVQDKTPASLEILISDYDLQDVMVLNLERAIQSCVDIGLHLISDLDVTPPDQMAQTFRRLSALGLLEESLAERLAKAVGFRNTAVHAYQELDWAIVYSIATKNLNDFRDFAAQMMKNL